VNIWNGKFKTNGNLRLYVCGSCGYYSRRGDHVSTHVRTHTRERPYLCDVCDKTYTTKFALNRHALQFHGGLPPADAT
jgi:KRAB domain-containing zinc finger protein